MIKPSCLTRALDQWNEDKSMRLWYNKRNVICIEDYKIVDITGVLDDMYPYYELETFGTYHFITSFQLSKKHLKLLGEYFNSLSNTKIV
jgi:hypothetical protein